MKALVTGANGHLGFNLCVALLRQDGVEVRASVRNSRDEAKVGHLRALNELQIVDLDICNRDQFDEALVGIHTLYHVAANYTVYAPTPELGRQIVRDTVEGVEIALRAAAHAGTAKVVLTSSVVTLPLTAPGADPVTEADWLEDAEVPYLRAKIQAERRAWELADELGLDLVTVLPGGIGGPGFARRTPTIDLLEGMMLGTLRFGAPNGNFTYVDARDAARGHILAAKSGLGGRFILCDQQPTFAEFTRVMHDVDPKVPRAPWVLPDVLLGSLPMFDALNSKLLGSARFITKEGVDSIRGRVYNVSSERAKRDLGWERAFPLPESLKDTIVAIREIRRGEGKRRMA